MKADVSTTKKLIVVLPKTLEKYMNAEGVQPDRRRASACACSPPSSARPTRRQDLPGDRAGEGQRRRRRQLRRRRRPDRVRTATATATASRTASTSTTTTTCSPTRWSSRSCSTRARATPTATASRTASSTSRRSTSTTTTTRTRTTRSRTRPRRRTRTRSSRTPTSTTTATASSLLDGVPALEVHVRGQPHRDADALAAVVLRRHAVLAVGATRAATAATPTMTAADYQPPVQFRAWAAASGYGHAEPRSRRPRSHVTQPSRPVRHRPGCP